jgi:hypothetical protein
MMVVFVGPCVFHKGSSHYLVNKSSPGSTASTGLQVSDRPSVRPPEVAIEIRNANVCLTLEPHSQIIDGDRSKDCFSRSGNPRTKQRLLRRLHPCLVFLRMNKPLSSPRLSPIDEIALLRSIIDSGKPIENTSFLIVLFPIQLIYATFCLSYYLTI